MTVNGAGLDVLAVTSAAGVSCTLKTTTGSVNVTYR